jgi:hypothetical protein
MNIHMAKSYSNIVLSLDVEYSLGIKSHIDFDRWLKVIDTLINFEKSNKNIYIIFAIVGELVDESISSEVLTTEQKRIIVERFLGVDHLGWHTTRHKPEYLYSDKTEFINDFEYGAELIRNIFNKKVELYVPPQNISIFSRQCGIRRLHSTVFFEKGNSWSEYSRFWNRFFRALNSFLPIDNSGSFFIRFNCSPFVFYLHMLRMRNYIKNRDAKGHIWFHPFNCIGFERNLQIFLNILSKCVG